MMELGSKVFQIIRETLPSTESRGDEAARHLEKAKGVVEQKLASICGDHSPFYWLSFVRRMDSEGFAYGDSSPGGGPSVQKICELAAVKYGDYSVHDWEEGQETGLGRHGSTIWFNFELPDALGLLSLAYLAGCVNDIMRLRKRIGKGARLVPTPDGLAAPFDDRTVEDLAALYDVRSYTYSDLVGNIGIFEPEAVSASVFREDIHALASVAAEPSSQFPDALPVAVKVEPEFEPGDEWRRQRFEDQLFVLPHVSYLRIALPARFLVQALTTTATFKRSFSQDNRGLSPEEMVFCIWLVDSVQLAVMQQEPLIWAQFHGSGFCSYDRTHLLKMWRSLASRREFLQRFSPAVRDCIRANKEELITIFYENFVVRKASARLLPLTPLTGGCFLTELASDVVLVDFTHLGSLLVDSTRFALEASYVDQEKDRVFETAVSRFVEKNKKVTSFWFEGLGSELEDEGGTFAEVDVAPIIGNCLLWVECKTSRWSEKEETGDEQYVQARWRRIAKGYGSWLSQAEMRARQAAFRRRWANGEVPKDIDWILPMVCTTRAEYIAEAHSRFFLKPGIPRICTPRELATFLDSWSWEELRGKPFLIPVRHAEGWLTFDDSEGSRYRSPEDIVESTDYPAPIDLQDWLNQGGLHLARGDLHWALACFERAIGLDKESLAAWSNRAAALARLGQVEGALESLDRVLESDPRDLQALILKGVILAEARRDSEGAIESYKRALKVDPELVPGWRNIAVCQARLGKYEAAMESLEKARDLDPDYPDLWSMLLLTRCASLLNEGKPSEAFNCCEEVLNSEPTNMYALRYNIDILLGLERWRDAVSSIDQVLRIAGASSWALNRKAVAVAALGDIKEALHLAEQSLKIGPGSRNTLQLRGELVSQRSGKEKTRTYSAPVRGANQVIEVEEVREIGQSRENVR